MAKRDLYNNIEVGSFATPFSAHTATIPIATATTVDTYGYYGVVFAVVCGVITDGTHTISLYESDTDITANYTAVAASDIQGAIVPIASGAAANQKFSYIGSKRYVRLVDTVATATTGGIYGTLVVFGYPLHKPAINP